MSAVPRRKTTPVMIAGRRIASPPSLAASRAYAESQLARLPLELRRLDAPSAPYVVSIARELATLAQSVDRDTH